MPDHDEGLARIDQMLEDYVPPSHLPLVPTPEEAEALGREPYHFDDDLGNPITWMLQEAEAIRRMQRQRQMTLTGEQLDELVMSELQRALSGIIPGLRELVAYREDFRWETYVVAHGESISLKYVMQRRRDPYRLGEYLTFVPRQFRPAGGDRWTEINPDLVTLCYYTQPNQRDQLAALMGRELFPDDLSTRLNAVSLTPVTIFVSDEVLAGRWRGHNPFQVIRDEVADFSIAAEHARQAWLYLQQLAPSAREAGNRIAQMAAGLRSEHDPEPESEPTEVPTSRRQPRRRGLQGQQSTYGPPQRGRRH